MKILVVLFLVAVTGTEALHRCAWAQILKDSGMDGYAGVSLADWLCLTWHESRFDTRAKNHNRDGSTDYGIFQINSRWWCTDGISRSANGCNVECSELLSNVDLSIACAKRVVRDPNGIRAWYGWSDHCPDEDVDRYLAGCTV